MFIQIFSSIEVKMWKSVNVEGEKNFLKYGPETLNLNFTTNFSYRALLFISIIII